MSNRNVVKQEENPKRAKPQLRSRCSICEEEGKIVLSLEMAGVKKEDLDINVDNNQLFITGKRSDPEIGGEYLLRERRIGDYYQSFTIDETIDRDKIEASLENGLLTVTLNLKEAEKPRKIEVKAG